MRDTELVLEQASCPAGPREIQWICGRICKNGLRQTGGAIPLALIWTRLRAASFDGSGERQTWRRIRPPLAASRATACAPNGPVALVGECSTPIGASVTGERVQCVAVSPSLIHCSGRPALIIEANDRAVRPGQRGDEEAYSRKQLLEMMLDLGDRRGRFHEAVCTRSCGSGPAARGSAGHGAG